MVSKYKVIIFFVSIICLFNGCRNAEDAVFIDSWKENLIKPSMQESVTEEIEGAVSDISEAVTDGIGHAKDTVSDAADNINGLLGEQRDAGKDSFLTKIGKSISGLLRKWGEEGAGKIDNADYMEEAESDGLYTQETRPSDTSILEDAQNSNKNRLQVELKRVVDGDTIIVEYQNDKVRVRLIGVNTPESVAPDGYLAETGKENSDTGKDSYRFLNALLQERAYVWLEFDADLEDDYGRALAYVWLSGDGEDIPTEMINAILLKERYAEVMTVKPNTRYEEEFEKISSQWVP